MIICLLLSKWPYTHLKTQRLIYLSCCLKSPAASLPLSAAFLMGKSNLSCPSTAHNSADVWRIHLMPQQQKYTLNLSSYVWLCIDMYWHICFFQGFHVKLWWHILVRNISIDRYIHTWNSVSAVNFTKLFSQTSPLQSITWDLWPINPWQCRNPSAGLWKCHMRLGE